MQLHFSFKFHFFFITVLGIKKLKTKLRSLDFVATIYYNLVFVFLISNYTLYIFTQSISTYLSKDELVFQNTQYFIINFLGYILHTLGIFWFLVSALIWVYS